MRAGKATDAGATRNNSNGVESANREEGGKRGRGRSGTAHTLREGPGLPDGAKKHTGHRPAQVCLGQASNFSVKPRLKGACCVWSATPPGSGRHAAEEATDHVTGTCEHL